MSVSILVVDDEPDVALLFRQRFRREVRDGDGTLYGQMTDELSQRAMWREWARRVLEEATA